MILRIIKLASSDPDPGDNPVILNDMISLCRLLLSKAEGRRSERMKTVRIDKVMFNGRVLSAIIRGTDTYNTRVTFFPRPGHHCECLDWSQNAKTVGPCKHVLALASHWDDVLVDRLERL